MQICNKLDNLNIDKPIVTIGSFDGVHLGHCQVIKQLTNYAQMVGGTSVIITFWPHPAMVLRPEKQISLLSTIAEKQQLLQQTHVDYLIVLPFTKEFSEIEYGDFVANYLVNSLHVDTLLLGYDNKVGHGGNGNFIELEQLAKKHGFNLKQLSALSDNSTPISSTKIRQLLSEGNVEKAASILGRNYSLSGKVVSGNRIGTKIGFPTANICPEKYKFIPKNGVYAVGVMVDNEQFYGMLNIGYRPTIDANNSSPTIEVNIFNFSRDIYGCEITITFLNKIRNEQQFASLAALQLQLKTDAEQIKQLVAGL